MSYNPILDLPKSRMYRDMTALGFYNLDGATLVRGEMRSYQYAIQVYLELIDSIAGGWWPLDCTLERLSQWEEVLGLPLRPRATEEQRRQTVLDLLSLGEQLRGPGGVERLLKSAIFGLSPADQWFRLKKLVFALLGMVISLLFYKFSARSRCCQVRSAASKADQVPAAASHWVQSGERLDRPALRLRQLHRGRRRHPGHHPGLPPRPAPPPGPGARSPGAGHRQPEPGAPVRHRGGRPGQHRPCGWADAAKGGVKIGLDDVDLFYLSHGGMGSLLLLVLGTAYSTIRPGLCKGHPAGRMAK